MKKMKEWTQLELPSIVRKTLVSVCFLLIIDGSVAWFGATFLSETISFFFLKTIGVIFSDLLFLEGAIAFAIGAFVEFGKSFQRTTPPDTPQSEQTTHRRKLCEWLLRPGILMMIVGAALFGLSILVGTFFA